MSLRMGGASDTQKQATTLLYTDNLSPSPPLPKPAGRPRARVPSRSASVDSRFEEGDLKHVALCRFQHDVCCGGDTLQVFTQCL